MTFCIERGVLKQYTGSDAVVRIPNGVTEIGYRAFYQNPAIEQVILPEGLSKIGIQAFSGCTVLKHVVFPDTLRHIGHESFAQTPWYSAQPDGIVYAGPVAWRIKGDMQQITIAELRLGTVKLCTDLFRNAAALTTVHLPDTLQEIDDRAFQNCRKLKYIRIPEQVRRIGDRAFDECIGLTVQLDCIKAEIGRHCFMNDTKVHVLHMPAALLPVNVREGAIMSFADAVYEGTVQDEAYARDMYRYIQNRRKQYYPLAVRNWNLLHMMLDAKLIPFEDVDGILEDILQQGQTDHVAALMRYKKSMTVDEQVDLFSDTLDDLTLDWDLPSIEKTVQQLEQEWGLKKNSDDTYTLMRYYGNETEITVPAIIGDKLISAIGPYALSPIRYGIKKERAVQLKKICTVTIQDGITRIGNNAFDGCTALYHISIPSSVEQIGKDAFAQCIWQNI